LRDHAGWSTNSRMPNVYIHYFGNESSKSLLEAYGIEHHNQKEISVLKTKNCPNCGEENRQDCRFCAKCRMVLSYDAYNETLQEQETQKSSIDRMEKIEKRMEKIDEVFTKFLNNKTT
jgi:ribosomal protein L37AE/L43A